MTLLTSFDLRRAKTPEQKEKASQETYNRWKIDDKIKLLKTNPPRIIREGRKVFTINDPAGNKLVTFDESSPTYQWMFTEPYFGGGLILPYILVDLDALAKAESLVKD